MKLELKDQAIGKGSCVFKVHDSRTGELLQEIRADNLIVKSTGHGYDIIAKQIGGDTTYPIAVSSAEIGSGNTAVSSADTNLATPVLTGIDVGDVEFLSAGVVRLSFFMTDTQLANGTYREFGLRCGSRLLTRLLISPELVKGTNQNITAEYTLTFG